MEHIQDYQVVEVFPRSALSPDEAAEMSLKQFEQRLLRDSFRYIVDELKFATSWEVIMIVWRIHRDDS